MNDVAYFSNSTDGDYLTQQCETCPAYKETPEMPEGGACPILLVQLLYNYDQLDKGQEKLKDAMTALIDDKGNCRMRPLIVVPEKPKDVPPLWLEEESS